MSEVRRRREIGKSMSSALAVSSVQYRFHQGKGQSQATAKDGSATTVASPTLDTSGSSAAVAGLNALLGRITAAGSIGTAGTPDPVTPPTADTTPAIKPNLDALNRVLAHYAAQSAAKDTVIALVKE